jgi:parvulin-like peptidyl-prolyl isomerase
MSFTKNAFICAIVLIALFAFCASATVKAQEGEAVVIDEVVAQVNDGVITLSQVKRELNDAIEALVQAKRLSREQAQKELEGKRAEFIARLIDELLLIQKGKEIGATERVETEVNKRMLSVAEQQGIKTLEELYKRMRESGVDPDAVKQSLRSEMMQNMVLNWEVDALIYHRWNEKQLREYFQKHPDKFKKPETVALSEIFLGFAGKKVEDVKNKAAQIVAQLRGGASFATLAATYSERTDERGNRIATETQGKVGSFDLGQLLPEFASAIKNVKAGGVSDPIQTDEGMEILRVDERAAGSDTPVYDEGKVREAMTLEVMPQERKKYMETLRADAYIKISESYRAEVQPFLTMPVSPSAVTSKESAKNKDKDKKKNNKN